MVESLIHLENVSLIKNAKIILQDIDLEVKAKEFITIVGPNGAGKSSLLHVILGLVSGYKGRVTRKEGLIMGYMPQYMPRNYLIPVNVLQFLRYKKATSAHMIDQTIAEVKIEPLLLKPLYALSGGEMQRVLLARALLNDPDLLILDEPAHSLDINGQLSLYQLITDVVFNRNCTVIMVSHDLHMVMASTSKVICLFHHICCAGHPGSVTKDPDFLAIFGDDMAKMMAIYQHSHNHEHDKFDGKS